MLVSEVWGGDSSDGGSYVFLMACQRAQPRLPGPPWSNGRCNGVAGGRVTQGYLNTEYFGYVLLSTRDVHTGAHAGLEEEEEEGLLKVTFK